MLENLIGFFVNTLVLRTDLSGDPTFRELLERVRGVDARRLRPPGGAVREAHRRPARAARSLSHTPLFQVMFILQNAPKQRLELPGLTLDEIEFDPGTAKFDLTVDMAEVDEGLSCAFEYSTDLFEASTITRMLDHFRALLEAAAADPAQRHLGLADDARRPSDSASSRRGTTPRPTTRASRASTSSSTPRPSRTPDAARADRRRAARDAIASCRRGPTSWRTT